MSYSTVDRYGGISTHYLYTRGGGPPGGTGSRTWWPDFGPGTHDFSAQRRSHPNEAIFESVVQPKHWSKEPKPAPSVEPELSQFRNPAPARVAMLESGTDVQRKVVAHVVTERQGALRRMELRQRKMDSWLGDSPIRMSNGYLADSKTRRPVALSLSGAQSEPSLGSAGNATNMSSLSAATVSRDVYEKHGYLVGRYQGAIADGKSGLSTRRHNALSMQGMLHGSSGVLQDRKDATHSTRKGPKKPTGQWRTTPESGFVFDPRTFLPVPRGGWDSHELSLTDWPAPSSAGNREFTDKDPFGDSLRHPSTAPAS